MSKYYVLVVKEFEDEAFGMEFGCYDRNNVRDELADVKYTNKMNGHKAKYAILTCQNATQASIDARVADYNKCEPTTF